VPPHRNRPLARNSCLSALEVVKWVLKLGSGIYKARLRDLLQQRVEELEARIALQEREYLEAPIETD
jgi:hypothetical protein